jgi:sugar (pentulose or hexulose) kinase
MKYRITLDSIRSVISYPIETVHIIGGGANNELLCQYTANALNLPVVAGPTEATAIGNILIQAKTMKAVSSLEEIRSMVGDSFETRLFEPQESHLWMEQLERFKKVAEAGCAV